MWELDYKESWALKNDAFKLLCLRRLLRVPWTARRSNKSILKEISPEYSLEGQMLKLKLQYFGHLMWRTGSLKKILLLGNIEGRRRREWQRMRWLNGITDSSPGVWVTPGIGNGQTGLASFVHGVAKSRTWLRDWTELDWRQFFNDKYVSIHDAKWRKSENMYLWP